jgi:Anti-sigma-K factor rskA
MSDIEPQSFPEFSPELLAGYVLGDLTPTEIAIVETYLAAHPEQQAEIAKLMLPLDLLSLTLPADNPPASLRSQILQTAAAETIVTAKPVEQFAAKSRQAWISLQSTTLRGCARAFAAGAGLLLLAGLGWNNYQLSHELAATKQDLKTAQIAKNTPKPQENVALVSLLQQPNNRFLTLKNMEGKSGMGMGSLVMVPSKSAAVLALQQIKPLPSGQVYRMWAIMGDEEMNCADFLPDANGKVLKQISLNHWEKAKKIMITIEEKSAKEAEGEVAIEGEI